MSTPTNNELPNMRDLTGSIGRYTAWINNFSAALTAGSATFVTNAFGSVAGPLVVADVAAIASSWNAALLLTRTTQRSHSSIVALRALRVGTELVPGGQVAKLREYIKTLQSWYGSTIPLVPALTPAQKIQCGITDLVKRRSRTFVPTEGPEISIHSRNAGVLKIRYNVVGKGQDSKAKPLHCKGVLVKWQVFVGPGNAYGSDNGEEVFQRSPGNITFPERLRGQRIGIVAIWLMGNKMYSPPSDTLYANIP